MSNKTEEKEIVEVVGTLEIGGHEFNVYGDFLEPLFLASEVAKLLNERDGYTVARKVHESEKATQNVCTPGGVQSSTFLTEFGLYEVFMKSTKVEGVKWKTEVKQQLKTIRLTGGYIHNTQQFVSHYFPDATDTQELIEKLEERIKLEDTINRLSIQRANKYLQDRQDSWKVQNEYKAKIDFLEELNEILTRNIRNCGYEFSCEAKKQLAKGEMFGYVKENGND